jgi:hypothetical protein
LAAQIEELDRIELNVGASLGYLAVNGQRRALPIGSSLNGGVFSWQLAPAFLGEYYLRFERPGTEPLSVRILVRPRKYGAGRSRAISITPRLSRSQLSSQ